MSVNDYKWPKIERLTNQSLLEDSDRIFTRKCLNVEIKYDGSNTSIDEKGQVYGRNQTVPQNDQKYQGHDLTCVRSTPVADIKTAFEAKCGIELSHMRVTGEFMVQPKSQWDSDKLGRFLVFGLLVQGKTSDKMENLVQKMSDQGFSVYINWSTAKYNRLTVFMNDTLKTFLKPFDLDLTESYKKENWEGKTLHEMIQTLPDDFFTKFEGLIITLDERARSKNEIANNLDASDTSINAMKWTQTNVTGDVKTLKKLSSMNKNKPWHSSVLKLIDMLGEERTSRGAMLSAMTKTTDKTKARFEAIRDVAEELDKLLTKKDHKILLSQIIDLTTNQP